MDRLAIEMPDVAAGIEKDYVFDINRLNVASHGPKPWPSLFSTRALRNAPSIAWNRWKRRAFFAGWSTNAIG